MATEITLKRDVLHKKVAQNLKLNGGVCVKLQLRENGKYGIIIPYMKGYIL